MRTILLAAAACALLAPTVTPAQLVLGAQGGVAIPRGGREEDVAMDGQVARAFPLELRAGWRLTSEVAVALQGGYGFVSDGEARSADCAATGADCTQHLWRLAARGEYQFPGEVWRPYGAALVGWEWLVDRWELAGDNWEQRSLSGWLAGVEAGTDRPLFRHLRAGAFVGLTLGQYRAQTVEGENAGYAYSDRIEVPSPKVHVWLGLGIRLAYQ